MLYLWMPEANGVWQWSRGENWNQTQSLEQLIQEIRLEKSEEAVVFFPSRDVQIIQQHLSKAQYKQLGVDGVKYLLEEYVIQPIDHMKVFSHFQQPDRVSILGVAQNTVLTLQHSLALIPVKVIALLPDFVILPVPAENEIILANVNGRLLVRKNEFLGNSIDDLALYLEFAQKGTYYKYSNLSDEQVESLFAVSTSDAREGFNYEFVGISKPKNHPYNVLPKAKQEQSAISGYWKACAVLVLALLVAQFSYDALRWVKLKKLADQTAMIAIDQYKAWFGNAGRVTEQNLRNSFEGNLRASQNGNTQALQLLSRVGPILMQHQIVANRINYDTAILNMDLVANSTEGLNTLVQQLNQQGFKAELGSVQTQGASVVGLVKIQ
ncbi:type II secretion system protein GspL [Acinetobacter sp. ANC 4648]|uniref:type II secretion system protein GspL n=1 Tax=Acinetobacter sp. ANC 4648 TaxID=1977875 RepID=UPI000A33CCB3|nr:type II secretion system protein GspL [Acinetobacter sp. ANC 4648]OTG83096.1 general secretion pathway protein GspL [Acinetobacter sp. ANC 4648]